MLLPIILVRVLSPEEVGVFKMFFLYLIMIPAFALTAGVMSGLAYWSGQEERKKLPAIQLSSALILAAAGSFFLISWYFSDYLAGYLPWSPEYSFIFSLALFGAISGTFFEESAIATGRIWTGALFYAGFELFRTAAILMAVFTYKTLLAVFVAHTAVVLFKVFSSLIYAYQLKFVGLKFNREIAQAVLSYAFPVSLAWVFGVFVMYADQFILSVQLPPSAFAMYAIGCLAIPPLLILEHSVTRVLIPQLSEAFASNNGTKGAALFKDGIESLAFLFIPAVTGLYIFSYPIIELLFTSLYRDAAAYLQIFAFTYLLLIMPYDAVARAMGDARWILRTFVFFSILSLLLVYFSASIWGSFGALGAIIAARLLMRVYSIYYTREKTSWRYVEFLPLQSITLFGVFCFFLALGCYVVKPAFDSEMLWFVVCAPAFALVYLSSVLSWKVFVTKREQSDAAKVLLITQSLNIGGLERMIYHLASELNSRRAEGVVVFVYDQKDASSSSAGKTFIEEFRKGKIPLEIHTKGRRFSFGIVFALLKSIYRNKVQIIHSHDLGGLIYAVFAKVLALGQIRLIHTQHSFIHLGYSKRYIYYEKFFTAFVDRIAAVSPDLKSKYKDLRITSAPVRIIYNGISFSNKAISASPQKIRARESLVVTYPDLESFKHSIWILYLARVFPGKGQLKAVEVWNQMSAIIRQKCALLFVGPASSEDEQRQLEKMISISQDGDRIFCPGATTNPGAWLTASDIYISASEYEGMPLGPLEAIASGLPALLSDIPGHTIFKESAKLFSLSNSEEGAKALEQLIYDREHSADSLYSRFWHSSSWVRAKYSVDKMSGEYITLYEEVKTGSKDYFSGTLSDNRLTTNQ
jgi:glycosyltransferase involved in cell wall biosynthesis/O-antigen/teichoic acid export membrane protein